MKTKDPASVNQKAVEINIDDLVQQKQAENKALRKLLNNIEKLRNKKNTNSKQ
jgi:hypothetical protein